MCTILINMCAFIFIQCLNNFSYVFGQMKIHDSRICINDIDNFIFIFIFIFVLLNVGKPMNMFKFQKHIQSKTNTSHRSDTLDQQQLAINCKTCIFFCFIRNISHVFFRLCTLTSFQDTLPILSRRDIYYTLH